MSYFIRIGWSEPCSEFSGWSFHRTISGARHFIEQRYALAGCEEGADFMRPLSIYDEPRHGIGRSVIASSVKIADDGPIGKRLKKLPYELDYFLVERDNGSAPWLEARRLVPLKSITIKYRLLVPEAIAASEENDLPIQLPTRPGELRLVVNNDTGAQAYRTKIIAGQPPQPGA